MNKDHSLDACHDRHPVIMQDIELVDLSEAPNRQDEIREAFGLLRGELVSAFREGDRNGIGLRLAALCVLVGGVNQGEAAERLRLSVQDVTISVQRMRSKLQPLLS